MAQRAQPTLLRTGDGRMYFIPGQQLEQYRVSDDKAAELERTLAVADQREPEVAGFSLNQTTMVGSLGFDELSDPMDPTASVGVVYCPGHRDY